MSLQEVRSIRLCIIISQINLTVLTIQWWKSNGNMHEQSRSATIYPVTAKASNNFLLIQIEVHNWRSYFGPVGVQCNSIQRPSTRRIDKGSIPCMDTKYSRHHNQAVLMPSQLRLTTHTIVMPTRGLNSYFHETYQKQHKNISRPTHWETLLLHHI
jgi:hypothetical protein